MRRTMFTIMIVLCISSLIYSRISFFRVVKAQHDFPVDLLIDYGNGTETWSTVFLSFGNNTAFSATQKGADSLTYTYFGDDIFVDAINGVWNNFTSGYWWAIFTWNHSTNTWSSLNIACNKHVMDDGGMVAWFYAVHPWPPIPPVDPPQTQVKILVDYGNGTSEWNMIFLSGAANAFKATQASVNSLDYSASDFGVFVDAINGVWNNFTSGYWWALFFWNGSAWESSLVGADSLKLSDGGTVAWFYAFHPWPPAPPPQPLYGDVNLDGRVDLQDLINTALIYRSREGDLEYNSFADLAPEWGVIDIFDIATIAYHARVCVVSAVSTALDYLRTVQQHDGSISNFAVSCWAVMAITAAGENPHSWEGGSGYSIVDYLILNKGTVNLSIATDVERFILAMTAADEDPRDIGGIDYVAALKTLFTNGQIGSEGLLNDDFFGVLALTSAGEPANSTIIQDSVSFLKENQNDDGGWGFGVLASSDVDMTSAAIMALTAAGEDNTTSTIVNATEYLRDSQRPNGGFSSWGEVNSASDSWAICAICSIGQTPFLWEVSGVNVFEHLLTLQNGDGSFNWTRNDPAWVDKAWYTSYAIVSLCLQQYPVDGVLIYLRVQGSKTTVWNRSVFVASSIIRDDQDLEHYFVDAVALGALDKAPEIGSFNYEVIQSGGGLELLSVAGERESMTKDWRYRVNVYSPNVTPDRFVWNVTSPPEPPHLELAFYVEVSPLRLGGGSKSPRARRVVSFNRWCHL